MPSSLDFTKIFFYPHSSHLASGPVTALIPFHSTCGFSISGLATFSLLDLNSLELDLPYVLTHKSSSSLQGHDDLSPTLPHGMYINAFPLTPALWSGFSVLMADCLPPCGCSR